MRFLAVLALPGCGFFETVFSGFDDTELVERAVTLEPVMIGGHATATGRREGTCGTIFFPGLPTRPLTNLEADEWLARGGAAAGIVPVAYANTVFPGAEPQPCDEWVLSTLQGKITFDFSTIPDGAVIETARLSFSAREWATPARGFLENTRDCRIDRRDDFAQIGVAASPIPGTRTSGAPLAATDNRSLRPARGLGPAPTNVTALVRVMVARDPDEQQFILSPKPALARQLHDDDRFGTTRYCAVHVRDIELAIEFLEPVPG